MLLDPVKQSDGNFYDSFGTQVTPFFVNSLLDTWSEYTVLHGGNDPEYPMGTTFHFTRWNIVCEKSPLVSGKSKLGPAMTMTPGPFEDAQVKLLYLDIIDDSVDEEQSVTVPCKFNLSIRITT